MSIESTVMASIASFIIGISSALIVIYPRVLKLEGRMESVCQALDEIKAGKINIECPKHDDLCRRVDGVEIRIREAK